MIANQAKNHRKRIFMKKPTKQADPDAITGRETVGLNAELQEWVESNAKELGIKPAMFMRMELYKSMRQSKDNGRK